LRLVVVKTMEAVVTSWLRKVQSVRRERVTSSAKMAEPCGVPLGASARLPSKVAELRWRAAILEMYIAPP
jgi:hypothetical protein